jgi:GNAT superfamily N-acetyltransferase
MFVLTAYHGQGIGQQLLDHALQFARSQHYTEIALTTHPLMKRAHRFYERNGFHRTIDAGSLYAYRRDL